MYDSSNYWKLGLFVMTTVALGIATLFWLGAGSMRSERPTYLVTYFDESVQGLSIGADLKFRGVKVGEVESIRVSNNTMHLEVLFQVFDDAMLSISYLTANGSDLLPRPVPELRAQLTSANLTGQKYVALDFASLKDRSMIPTLPEGVRAPPQAELFVAARPSTLKSFEDALNNALILFDNVGPEVGSMVSSLESLLRGAEQADIPDEARLTLQRLREALGEAEGAIATFQSRVEAVDTAGLSNDTNQLINRATAAVDGARNLLDSLSDEEAAPTRLSSRIEATLDLIVDEVKRAQLPDTTVAIRDGADAVTRAADAVTGAANQVATLTDDLDVTLSALRQTIDSLRGLILVLQHDPSSILRGRGYGAPPPPITSPGNKG